ncbi:MAG: bifunctional hydroxymethylpyrimidine kinase/phosphomethylpyrimidine kinase [Pseudomonadota bacterium]|nr:bifunctional hydroxymethylpyrimidine kinase/phosphomethylpyrimidine kinase [Pseudomonadota bacterium]
MTGARIPNILAIAGSDPSGGAGIQADIKAISANGGYAMAALTALTAQNTRGVTGVQAVPPDFVTAQIDAVRADIRVDAVKIGMIASAEVARAVGDALAGLSAPVALDPVMVAKGGDRLLAEDALDALRTRLLPLAAVLTPNLPEAAALLDRGPINDRADMERAAEALLALGPRSVLLKGGHLGGETSPDLLLSAEGAAWFERPRHPTRNTHGTGCTLSSALAAHLGRAALAAEGGPVGAEDLRAAAQAAGDYVAGAIAAADRLEVGGGHGPLHHFFRGV